MRHMLTMGVLLAGVLLLAACGNKGPLVRAPTHASASAATQAAPAASVEVPAGEEDGP